MSLQPSTAPLLAQAIGGTIGLGLATSLGWLAWRSSVDEWRALNQRWRPRSWRKWPVYSVLWRHFDEHTAAYLWLNRVMFSVAATLIAIGWGYAIIRLIRGTS